jgi:hypothetical protein
VTTGWPRASIIKVMPEPEPLPLLFLVADTGGGHRHAARAVGQALQDAAAGVRRGRTDGDLLAAQRVDDDVRPGGRSIS